MSNSDQLDDTLKKKADEQREELNGQIRHREYDLHITQEQILRHLQNFSTKLLSENTQKLEKLVREMMVQLAKLESFDCCEFVKAYCEELELEVSETIQHAIEHLDEIEKKTMKQIREYREKCLEHLSCESSEQECSVELERAQLTKEVSEFNARWSKYFEQKEVIETESEIEAALTQNEYISKMKSMEIRLQRQALNWEKMVFNVNSEFLEELNHVGQIELITELEKEIDRDAPAEATMPDTATPSPVEVKKLTIIEKPCFTLTGHYKNINQVLFLPDGRLASCSDDEMITIWNVEDRKELFQLSGHTGCVASIAFLSNGHLASGSEEGTIIIWDLEQEEEIRTIQAHSSSVVSLRELKNENLASYSHDDTIKIWNLNSKLNKPVSTLRGHGKIFWWQLIGVLSDDNLVMCSGVSLLSFNDPKCILRVWNPNEPKPIKSVSTGRENVCSLLVLSNDQVALGFYNGTIMIIDVSDEPVSRIKERAHENSVSSLAQFSNENLISAGFDKSKTTIKVWNLSDWNLLQTINAGDSNAIYSLSISADERYLATGSAREKIRLWQISSE